jgi:hypothetical protein
VLDVHALDRPDTAREVEYLRLAEGFGGVPAAVCSKITGGLRPLRSSSRWRRRSEVIAVDREVGAVPGAQFFDVVEEVIGGVPGEDVRQPGFDTDPHQCQPSGGSPLLVEGELLVTQFDARKFVRALRVRLGERHRHVQVVRAGLIGPSEDRHHKARVDRIQYVGRSMPADGAGDRVGARGIDSVGDQPPLGTEPFVDGSHRAFCSFEVVVGHDQGLEEGPPGHDLREGIADPPSQPARFALLRPRLSTQLISRSRLPPKH